MSNRNVISPEAQCHLDSMRERHKLFMEEFAKDNFDFELEGYASKDDPYMLAYTMAGKITRALLPTEPVPPKPRTVAARVFAKALIFSFMNPTKKPLKSYKVKEFIDTLDVGTLGTTIDEN